MSYYINYEGKKLEGDIKLSCQGFAPIVPSRVVISPGCGTGIAELHTVINHSKIYPPDS
jgi:hypothetical protein